jgi:hypothetical protein
VSQGHPARPSFLTIPSDTINRPMSIYLSGGDPHQCLCGGQIDGQVSPATPTFPCRALTGCLVQGQCLLSVSAETQPCPLAGKLLK